MEENYNGQHYIIEFYSCPPQNLQSAVDIENILCQAANKCSSQILSKFTHHFSPNGGVSSIVTIEESHISVHTWPEYGYAALDFYTTGERDPLPGIQTLREYFQPKEEALQQIKRGLTSKMSQNNNVPTNKQVNNYWWLTDHVEEENGLQQTLRMNGKPLYEIQSKYQNIQVFQSDQFGKVLALDSVLQVSERDEAFYHEMISHVPIFAHPNPKRILVIGGGDGGTVRECLKHQEIEEIILCEIDDKVIETSKLFFPNVACALDKDPRLKILIQDGYLYVQQQQGSQFDIIIIDSSDPLGTGELLFSEKFYRETYRLLKPLGILITQAENPLGWPQDLFASYFQYLRNVFGQQSVYAYHAIVPIYTGNMYFSFNSKGNIHPYKNLDLEKIKNWSEAMNCIYYDEQVHGASFALPKYIQDLISPKQEFQLQKQMHQFEHLD